MSTEELTRRLNGFLDENGIETALIVLRNPDDSECATHRRGETLWLLGAARGVTLELEQAWADRPYWAKGED